MSASRQQKTDFGTIVLHWVIVLTLVAALITGLSIAREDNPDLWVVYYFGDLLPATNVWFYHLLAGLGLVSALCGYAFYIRSARLSERVSLGARRLLACFRGRSFWSVCNILLYWIFFFAIAISFVSGAFLFLGWTGLIRPLHLHLTWLFIAFTALHPLLHWLHGGTDQLFRIFRPRWQLPPQMPPLVEVLIERLSELETDKPYEPSTRRSPTPKAASVVVPLLLAAAGAATVWIASLALEEETRPVLKVKRIAAARAPAIDGELSDAAWRGAPMATAWTDHGANFDGGDCKVEVRAVHDGTFAYFFFTWADPTRSLMHMPLVKEDDGWHLLRSAKPGKETRIHEDKFAVLLADGGQPLLGKGIHFGRWPASGKPEGVTGRGLHYVEGGTGEVWQWRASHGGLLGWIDHGHFGAPVSPGAAPIPGQRYAGGFSLDAAPLPYSDNFERLTSDDAYPLVRPLRLPSSASRILRLAGLNLDPEQSDEDAARPWLTLQGSVPYSDEIDRLIPRGAVIPSIVLTTDRLTRNDATGLAGAAHWASGRWSLEVRRRLNTGNPEDAAVKTGTLMWVAAFDHAETWHSYHIRPFVLEVE